MDLRRAVVGVLAAAGLVAVGALIVSTMVPGFTIDPLPDAFDSLRCRERESLFGVSGTATPLEQQVPFPLLRTHCLLTFQLTVESIVGALEIRIRGPSGTIYEADVAAVDSGTGNGVPLHRVERASESEVATGTYTLHFRATGQAVFKLEGWGEPAPS